jgi:hypothetical protein
MKILSDVFIVRRRVKTTPPPLSRKGARVCRLNVGCIVTSEFPPKQLPFNIHNIIEAHPLPGDDSRAPTGG